jgi:hypothetical protein
MVAKQRRLKLHILFIPSLLFRHCCNYLWWARTCACLRWLLRHGLELPAENAELGREPVAVAAGNRVK